MATGTDLTEEDGNPRLHGRKPKNEDLLEPGVWIRHPETGVTHLVTHKYQVNRLLIEGGKVVEKPEPTATPVQTTVESESVEDLRREIARLSAMLNKREDGDNGSTTDDGTTDSQSPAHDRRSARDKSAVR